MKHILSATLSAIVFILFCMPVRGQQNDTLQLARQLREKKEVDAALKILSPFAKSHPDDLNALWLYANTAYVAHDYGLSVKVYREAAMKFPSNYILLLDYAKILTSLGRLNEAVPLLRQCLNQADTRTEATFYLASVYYWQVRYDEASELLNRLLKAEPGNTNARQLLEKIREDKSTAVSAGFTLSSDDQPMTVATPRLSGKMYTKALHELEINLDVPVFSDDSLNTFGYGLRVGNQFLINRAELALYLEAGIFSNPDAGKTLFTGQVKLSRTFFRKLNINAGFERKPYYLTLVSARNPLAVNHSYFSLGMGKENHWTLKAGLDHSAFPADDNNSIFTAYGWVISPPLWPGRLKVMLGYGFNYSNAANSRFRSTRSLEKLVSDSVFTGVEGAYNPYFTPKDMQVHSALGIINLAISRKIEMNVKVSYGFYGVADNPYLFIQQSVGSAVDTLMISRQFVSRRFNPYEVNAGISCKLSRKLTLSASYSAFSTLYYKSSVAGISIRKIL